MKNKNRRTLVLNADYMPLTIISWQRAIVLIMDERVTQLDFYKSDSIKDGHGRQYPIPAVVASRKKNVYIRDSLRCAYCNQRFEPKDLTFDHVIPRSLWKRTRQGTPTCWENIVTCCVWCNRTKADKTCEQARMFPSFQPSCPSYGEMFLGISPWKESMPSEWIPYLKHLSQFKGLDNNAQQETPVLR
jgi:5-methylcytosine-specific restriction endonuclease McrA